MIRRSCTDRILRLASQYPVVTVTGPRQSGKTTLCKALFPEYAYANLESPDQLDRVMSDPKAFLAQSEGGLIIDEVQRFPELLSWIQVAADESGKNGRFILTGSQNFQIRAVLGQSLAGRTAIVHLLPLSIAECRGAGILGPGSKIDSTLLAGFYPRIFDKALNPSEASEFYISTYLEREVRGLAQVQDLGAFHRFLRLCAGRTACILNRSSLANEAGISQATVDKWLSILEASYIISLSRPYHRNFSKRIVKAPKLHFLDVGLASWLLGMREAAHVETHPLRGQLFESMMYSDILKTGFNSGDSSELFHFRDSNGNEVDIIRELGQLLEATEIKSSLTYRSDFMKGLNWFGGISRQAVDLRLVYGGEESFSVGNCRVESWLGGE